MNTTPAQSPLAESVLQSPLTLFVREVGTSTVSFLTRPPHKTTCRRVELQRDGICVADFVQRNNYQSTTEHPDEIALAEQVLRAFNTHDALVASLSALLDLADVGNAANEDEVAVYNKARAALALARK